MFNYNNGYSTSSKYYDGTEQFLAEIAPVLITTVVVLSIIAIITAVGNWFLFKKAGQPGWKALIPFYNNYVLFQIADLNPWLSLLLYINPINIVMSLILDIKLAKVFGRGGGFALGLLLFPPIFVWLIAASDKYEYQLAKGKNVPFGEAFERPEV
ncbi:hypothetical protein IKF76_00340 [Candidatus Saccharibacteria bacterium]|nr:hypothetical protein [Candidatus Saccharibacteria bacterium]